MARSPPSVVWLSSLLGEVFMIRAVFGTSLLVLFSATMVCHASEETRRLRCQLRYENVVWPNCIKFHTLSGDELTRDSEGLHHCQTYAALWFNRCMERHRRGYPNCGPGAEFRGGWHCR
jgi:hypothetical protein